MRQVVRVEVSANAKSIVSHRRVRLPCSHRLARRCARLECRRAKRISWPFVTKREPSAAQGCVERSQAHIASDPITDTEAHGGPRPLRFVPCWSMRESSAAQLRRWQHVASFFMSPNFALRSSATEGPRAFSNHISGPYALAVSIVASSHHCHIALRKEALD